MFQTDAFQLNSVQPAAQIVNTQITPATGFFGVVSSVSTVTYVGAGAKYQITTTGTAALPTGYVTGDLLFAFGVGSTTAVPTISSGWTLISSSTTVPYLSLWYRIATSASETAPTITATGGGTATGAVLAYHNVNGFDVQSSIYSVTSTSAPTPSITTTADGDLVISFYGEQASVATWGSAPSGTTLRTSSAGTAAYGGYFVVDELVSPAGATTSRAAGTVTSKSINAQAIAFTAKTVSGAAPAVLVSATITSALGALTLASDAPTVTLTSAGSNTTITPLQGSITCTGFAPVVTQQNFDIIPQGIVTLLGVAPGVVQAFNITPLVGSVTINGPNAVVTNQNIDVPTTGAVALTGIAPVVVYANTDIPLVGAVALTGFSPVLTTLSNTTITPTQGVLQIDFSVAPGIGRGYQITQGSVALNGFAPLIGRSILLPSGSLTLTGFAPTLSSVLGTNTQQGSVALQGFAPAILQTQSNLTQQGSVALTGFAPAVINPITITPATALLDTGDFHTTYLNHCDTGTGTAKFGAHAAVIPTDIALFSGFPVVIGPPITLEFWANLGVSQSVGIVSDGTGNYSQQYFAVANSSGQLYQLQFFPATGGMWTISFTPLAAGWHHIAWCHSAGLSTAFVDGVQVGSSATALLIQDALWYVTAIPCTIDELRVSNLVRYTGNFTPPTVAFTTAVAPVVVRTITTVITLNIAPPVALTGYAPTVTQQIYSPVLTPGSATLSVSGDPYYGSILTLNHCDSYTGTPLFGTHSLDLAVSTSPFISVPYGQPAWTVEAWVKPPAIANAPLWIINADGSNLFGNPQLLALTAAADGSVASLNWNDRTTLVNVALPANAPGWHHIAFCYSGGMLTPFFDGVAFQSRAATFDYDSPYYLGGGSFPPGTYINGGLIDEFRITYVARYTGNFGVLNHPFPDNAGLAPTVVRTNYPATTSLALTGFAPTVASSSSLSITPTTGSVTLTGTASTTATTTTPLQGLISLVGVAPVATQQLARPTQQGTAILTGFAPALAAGVTTQQGTIGLASVAPTVSVTTVSNTTITPSQGSVTLTGYASTLVAANIDTPVQGSVTLTGFAPVLAAAGAVSPVQGSVTLTGFAPVLTLKTTTTLNTGAVTLTGTAPVLSAATKLVPAAGAATLTGFAPTVALASGAAIPAGTVTLTGFAPTLKQTFSAATQTGAVAITGSSPTAMQNNADVEGTGAVTLSGFAPLVTQQRISSPVTGTLTITGAAPTVRQTFSIAVPAGSLALQSSSPSNSGAIQRNTLAGAVTFTSYAPTVWQTLNVTPATGALATTADTPLIHREDTLRPAMGLLALTSPIYYAQVEIKKIAISWATVYTDTPKLYVETTQQTSYIYRGEAHSFVLTIDNVFHFKS